MEEFQKYRPLLFSIAYRMLGSAVEAEDIVQEAYLRYSAAPRSEIRSLKSYLTTTTARLCIDHLKSARVEREQYIGPWLPEPVLTDSEITTPLDATERLESVSIAFLMLLECLSPQERAVFLLHEVFDYDYEEISEIIDKSAANCRQILHRAKEQISQGRPRFEPSRETHKQLTESFFAAVQSGDLNMLTNILAEDAVIRSDGGGKVRAALRPIVGRDAVVRFIFGLLKKAPEDFRITFAEVNGRPALLSWLGERLFDVVDFEIADGKIKELHFILNPDKLAYILRQIETRTA